MIRVLKFLSTKYNSHKLFIANTLIILSVLLFCFIGIKNFKSLDVPYFGTAYESILINIELKNKYKNLVSVGTENHISPLYVQDINAKNSTNNFYTQFNIPAKEFYLLIHEKYKQHVLSSINSMSINLGKDFHTFDKKQISELKESSITIKNIKLAKFSIPQEQIKKVKSSDYINFKGYLRGFTILFLSFFYMSKLYILPWILFFAGIFTYPKIKNEYWLLATIFILGTLFRFSGYAQHSLWWDELYSIMATGTNNLKDIQSIFNDPGNPPAFYLLSKIWSSAFGINLESIRILPVIFGSLGILSIFALAKYKFNNKIALISSIIYTFSIFSICYAQEYRCYSMLMCLAPIEIYLFFKMLEEKTVDYVVLFTIISCIFINTHLYSSIFILLNFLYGIWYLASKKESLLRFLTIHLLILASFIPFVIITFFKDALMVDYNSWIDPISLARIKMIVSDVFGNLGIFAFLLILSLSFVAISYCNEKYKYFCDLDTTAKNFIYYLIYFIYSFWIFVLVFSLYRSIFICYYFTIIYPLIIILLSALVGLNRRYKIINIILSIAVVYFIHYADFYNLWKNNRTYQHLSDIANHQALMNPDAKVISFIDPVLFHNFFASEPNVSWLGKYNSTYESAPGVVDIIDNILETSYYKKLIFCVSYSELAEKDRLILFDQKSPYKYAVDSIKNPYFENRVIRIRIER